MATNKKYKCLNIGNCTNANENVVFEIPVGEKLICPKCHKEMLVEVKPSNWKLIAAIAGVVVAAGGGATYFLTRGGTEAEVQLMLDKTTCSLVAGASDTLTVTTVPADAGATFVWKSSDTAKATVSPDGIVASLAPGEVTISVQTEDGAKSASCTYIIKEEGTAKTLGEAGGEEVNAESLSFAEKALAMNTGDTGTLAPTVTPAEANERIVWTSSDEAVVNVSESGLVTAVGNGKATVTAIAERSGQTASVEVTVSEKVGGDVVVTIELGYGTYTGRVKNGKPHDPNGTIVYKKAQQIESRDVKKRVANPGDRVIGNFENGHLINGKWIKSDGNTEQLMIGG